MYFDTEQRFWCVLMRNQSSVIRYRPTSVGTEQPGLIKSNQDQYRATCIVRVLYQNQDASGERPQKALRGGILSPVLEPFPRCWSHFVANCCQKLTNLVKIDFEIPPRRALRGFHTSTAAMHQPSREDQIDQFETRLFTFWQGRATLVGLGPNEHRSYQDANF